MPEGDEDVDTRKKASAMAPTQAYPDMEDDSDEDSNEEVWKICCCFEHQKQSITPSIQKNKTLYCRVFIEMATDMAGFHPNGFIFQHPCDFFMFFILTSPHPHPREWVSSASRGSTCLGNYVFSFYDLPRGNLALPYFVKYMIIYTFGVCEKSLHVALQKWESEIDTTLCACQCTIQDTCSFCRCFSTNFVL